MALVLIEIDRLWKAKGYAPTYEEVGIRTGMVKSHARSVVLDLVEAGLVDEEPRIPRTLRLTDSGRLRVRELTGTDPVGDPEPFAHRRP